MEFSMLFMLMYIIFFLNNKRITKVSPFENKFFAKVTGSIFTLLGKWKSKNKRKVSIYYGYMLWFTTPIVYGL